MSAKPEAQYRIVVLAGPHAGDIVSEASLRRARARVERLQAAGNTCRLSVAAVKVDSALLGGRFLVDFTLESIPGFVADEG